MKYRVVAHPGAKQTRIVVQEDADGQIYHVYTNAKAIDGAANEAIIKLMADFL